MTVQQYLNNFTSLVKWDVQKLIDVAEEGEEVQKKQFKEDTNSYATRTQTTTVPIPTPSAGVIPVGAGSGMAQSSGSGTHSGSSNGNLFGNPFLEQHTPEAAKCAVPMAMALIAAAEFVGSLLSPPDIWEARDKFDRAITKFFNYADSPLHKTELDVVRQSFRNGMAHNFMMQGQDVAIDYQQRFKSIDRLLFIEGQRIVLNVNKLQEIVFNTFDKLLTDTSIHPTIFTSVQEYESGATAIKTARFLSAFKKFDSTRN